MTTADDQSLAPPPAGRRDPGQPGGPHPFSAWADLGGPVHYLDYGGPARAPVIVCVHGLGGSAVNWSALAPLLTGGYRVLAPDLAGHGLTESAGRGTSVAANRALLHRFITTVAGGPVILMGNSMGGMITLLEATAAPGTVAGLILLDPALPFAPAWPDPLVATMFALYLTPGVGQLLVGGRRRLTPEMLVTRTLALCCANPRRVAAGILAEHIDIARRRTSFTGTERDFAAAVRSVVATAGPVTGRRYRRGLASVTCPVLLLHGDRDRLVPLRWARAAARAHPAWSLVVLPGVGHVPQLEVPAETAAAITGWLGGAGSSAAAGAGRAS
jgi:pimeloyl-ACP methyl ester carboxylesterase